jgi:hypothetical protein
MKKKFFIAVALVLILINSCFGYNYPLPARKNYCYFGQAIPGLTLGSFQTGIFYLEGEFKLKEAPLHYQLSFYHALDNIYPSFSFIPSATKLALHLKYPWLNDENFSISRFIGTTITVNSSTSASLDIGLVLSSRHSFWSRFYFPLLLSLYPDGFILNLTAGFSPDFALWRLKIDFGLRRDFISLFNGTRFASDMLAYFALGSDL